MENLIEISGKKYVSVNQINTLIQSLTKVGAIKTDDISDGYHTIGELYKHRIHLFIALCHKLYRLKNQYHEGGLKMELLKSRYHFDGSEFEGRFIIQIESSNGQISYHLPMEYWDKCCFIESQEKAHKWDGHTSDDVLKRLLEI